MGWPVPFSLTPVLYKMYVMFPGTWAQEFVGRFQPGEKNITAEKHVLLGYFAVLVSSLNILWIVVLPRIAECGRSTGCHQLLSSPSGGFLSPQVCFRHRLAPSWANWELSFISNIMICSIGQCYRLTSLKFAPCDAFWRQVYWFLCSLGLAAPFMGLYTQPG